jgi:hypothetical protein
MGEFETPEELVDVGRILHVQENQEVKELNSVPQNVEIRKSVFEEEEEREQNDEPTDSFAELAHDHSRVDLGAGILSEKWEFQGNVRILQRE